MCGDTFVSVGVKQGLTLSLTVVEFISDSLFQPLEQIFIIDNCVLTKFISGSCTCELLITTNKVISGFLQFFLSVLFDLLLDDCLLSFFEDHVSMDLEVYDYVNTGVGHFLLPVLVFVAESGDVVSSLRIGIDQIFWLHLFIQINVLSGIILGVGIRIFLRGCKFIINWLLLLHLLSSSSSSFSKAFLVLFHWCFSSTSHCDILKLFNFNLNLITFQKLILPFLKI